MMRHKMRYTGQILRYNETEKRGDTLCFRPPKASYTNYPRTGGIGDLFYAQFP